MIKKNNNKKNKDHIRNKKINEIKFSEMKLKKNKNKNKNQQK
jgi:hypothetical protein